MKVFFGTDIHGSEICRQGIDLSLINKEIPVE